ncbi:ABC transporter ATP-binding protein [Paenibacillus yanchengensis]|uniref:ABC transporter ATP-binding protein n=1 Tax=Paenibacillus yanchengensis TaxID=2035833 RepID=A0ABW4YLW9_9BACL
MNESMRGKREQKAKDTSGKSPSILKSFVRNVWHVYALAIFFHLIAHMFNVNFPNVLGKFTDQLKDGQLTGQLVLQFSLLLLLIGVGHVVFNGLGMYLIMKVGRKFEFITRSHLFRHFTSLSERFYSNHSVGKLLSYFMNDVTAVRESISIAVNQAASAIILLIAAVSMMLAIGIPYYLIIASVVPLLLIPLIVTTVGPIIKQRSRKVQEALGEMTETAEEQFGGIRVTKKFAVETIMNERFAQTVEQIKEQQLRLVRVSSFFQAVIPFLGTLSLVIALAYGGYLTMNGTLSLGNFVALTLYIRMLMNPLQQIGNVINTIQRSRASLERLNDLLSKTSEIEQLEEPKQVSLDHASIEMKNLQFAYRKKMAPVLDNVSITMKPGMTVGIVGKTGSGKTTLMKLLLRTYDPPPRTVFIGGVDIRELSLENLRTGIGYVPQDGFLFSTTLRENIAFSDRKLPLEKVESAAQQAQIYKSITTFPKQFDTRLGERGLTLSGGQRQRTSLARGLITDAPILILDDSVSAVDAVTETKIIDSVKRARKGKTTIIVAHRLSAVEHADLIVVLDEGKIVAQGTHEQLLAAGGQYARIYAIQKEGDPDALSAQ